MLPEFVEALGDGVYAIDTGFHRPRFDAAYLIVQQGHGAFVDTGTNHSVPRLLAALDALGIARDRVDYVIPTHVHLDHAGGVGLLMSELPQAQALVMSVVRAIWWTPRPSTVARQPFMGRRKWSAATAACCPWPPIG